MPTKPFLSFIFLLPLVAIIWLILEIANKPFLDIITKNKLTLNVYIHTHVLCFVDFFMLLLN